MYNRNGLATAAARLRRDSTCKASSLYLIYVLKSGNSRLQHLKENTEAAGSEERAFTSTTNDQEASSTFSQQETSSRSSLRAQNNSTDERCYSNFTHDLAECLYELPTLRSTSTLPAFSSLNVLDHAATQTEAAVAPHKRRFPSASSSQSRNSSTRSKFDHCLQEMLLSHSSEAAPTGGTSSRASARLSAGKKTLKSSTSSSLSSCEQSADLISEVNELKTLLT